MGVKVIIKFGLSISLLLFRTFRTSAGRWAEASRSNGCAREEDGAGPDVSILVLGGEGRFAHR